MGAITDDYYNILQVHHKADPEIIMGAYRLLSKKYHPDVNKSYKAEEKMKRINIAYGVLSDKGKRALYDIERERHKRSYAKTFEDRKIDGACQQIKNYYRSIIDGDYYAAYDCISTADKKHIGKTDFIKWRKAVDKTFELRSCEVSYYKTHRKSKIADRVADEAFEFTISICERNIRQNIFSEYKATKIAIIENGGYSVFLGYKDVKAFTGAYAHANSYNSDTDVEDAYDFCNYEAAMRFQATNALNVNDFLNAAAAEESRYKRHANVFSIAVFEVLHKSASKRTVITKSRRLDESADNELIQKAAQFLAGVLRDIDILCLLGHGRFVALFPETGAAAATQAANRICNEFNRLFLAENTPASFLAMYASACEYDSRAIGSTIDKCLENMPAN